MRIIPAHKKYRRKKAGITLWHGDLRSAQGLLSRPIIGHTPQKLPGKGPQSPASSQFRVCSARSTAPNASSFIIQDLLPNVKHYFSVFYKISEKFLDALTRWLFPLKFPLPAASLLLHLCTPAGQRNACQSSPRYFLAPGALFSPPRSIDGRSLPSYNNIERNMTNSGGSSQRERAAARRERLWTCWF